MTISFDETGAELTSSGAVAVEFGRLASAIMLMRAARLARHVPPRVLLRTAPAIARSVAQPRLLAAPALVSAGSLSFCSAPTPSIHALEATAVDGSKVSLDLPKPMVIVNVASR